MKPNAQLSSITFFVGKTGFCHSQELIDRVLKKGGEAQVIDPTLTTVRERLIGSSLVTVWNRDNLNAGLRKFVGLIEKRLISTEDFNPFHLAIGEALFTHRYASPLLWKQTWELAAISGSVNTSISAVFSSSEVIAQCVPTWRTQNARIVVCK